MAVPGKAGHPFGIRVAAELVIRRAFGGIVFTLGRINAAVGAVTFSKEIALVLAGPFAFLLGTRKYESKVFERRLAADESVFAVCDRSTGRVVDLCRLWRSSLGLRRAAGIGDVVVTVLERGLEGDAVDNASGRGVDKFGGSGDTTLMVYDRGLQGNEGGNDSKDADS